VLQSLLVELHVELCVELRVELLQGFGRAWYRAWCRACRACRVLVELDVLKFVTWILPQLTARTFFLTNEKLAWREFEIQDPKI
jgi:hypothetical protein